MSTTSDMLRRHAATDKTLRKYRGRPLDWANYDCLRMLRSHLIAMGHKGIPKLPRYTTALGAVRAFKATGFADLEELIDSVLPTRIAPAEMMLGDVALLRADPSAPFDAITISVGRKVMGWHDEADALVMMTALEFKAAWRV